MWRKFSFIICICFVCVKLSAQYKGSTGDGYSMCVMSKLVILPIELCDFDAVLEVRSVRIIWKTMSEINNSYFEIERSKDLESWDVIAHVDGANNSNQLIQYEWTDENPNIGVVYYRLKQVDFDGNSSCSKVLSLKIEEIEHNIIEVYPNPVTSNIVHFDNDKEEPFLIRIYSQLGQFVFQKMLNGSSIELPNLMHGVYVLKFENLISGDVQYARMVKGE